MKLKITKVISIILLVIILLINLMNIVSASTPISSELIQDKGDCGRHLQYYKTSTSEWSYIICHFAVYTENGKQYPAYCLDQSAHGVGDEDDYTVKISKILDDEKVWRTIINGYPYKTPSQLGVENKYDAFVATKQAVYCILYNYNPKTRYRGADERGEKIASAIVKLVNIGKNGTQKMKDGTITISKNGALYEKENYFIQKMKVSSSVDISSYSITATANMPEGAIITDINNKEMKTFKGGENFLIKIPKKSMVKDINTTISIQGKCKTYPVFYGKAPSSSLQDYALTYDPYGDGTGKTTLDFKTNTGKIKIKKTESNSSTPIEGVVFGLYDKEKNLIEEVTTDEEGIAIFNNLYQDNYILKEISTTKDYVLDEKEFDVNVEFNKETVVEVKNKLKKGQIKVIKVDSNNKEIKLAGVKFEVLDENKNVLEIIETDKNGEALTKEYAIRDYKNLYLREIKTKKGYKLDEKIKKVVLKENEITNITIKNKLEELPKTGIDNEINCVIDIVVLLLIFVILLKNNKEEV